MRLDDDQDIDTGDEYAWLQSLEDDFDPYDDTDDDCDFEGLFDRDDALDRVA